MNMVLLVPDGVGVRNFVFDRFIQLVQLSVVREFHAAPEGLFDVCAQRCQESQLGMSAVEVWQ